MFRSERCQTLASGALEKLSRSSTRATTGRSAASRSSSSTLSSAQKITSLEMPGVRSAAQIAAWMFICLRGYWSEQRTKRYPENPSGSRLEIR